jgi:hypothetical protein
MEALLKTLRWQRICYLAPSSLRDDPLRWWSAMDAVPPIGGTANNPLSGIAHLGDPTAAALAGGGLMSAAWTSTQQHLTFGGA